MEPLLSLPRCAGATLHVQPAGQTPRRANDRHDSRGREPSACPRPADQGASTIATSSALESWAPKATLAPGSPNIVYPVGALVMYDAEMDEAIVQSTGLVPPDHAEALTKLPLPVDDLRATPGSAYAGMGVK
jgi:hypothetical protein